MKLYNYLAISTGLALLLQFAGLPTAMSVFLNYVGLSGGAAGIQLSPLWAKVGVIFSALVGIGGIVTSFFAKSSPESYIVATISGIIFSLISTTFVALMLYTQQYGYVYYMVELIFGTWLVGFVAVAISWWRGAD